MKIFRNRVEAGELLARKLKKYHQDEGIVLAVPRGGIPVAYAVARALNFPLRLILTKKIGHPLNREYAIGAASLTDHFVISGDDIPADYIRQELVNIRAGLKEMYAKFIAYQPPRNLEGKTVIVVDDGIATGNTLIATVSLLRKNRPAKIIIAAPVAPESALVKLAKEVDDVVAVYIPQVFYGVGSFYDNFTQVSDEEVMSYLGKFSELEKQG